MFEDDFFELAFRWYRALRNADDHDARRRLLRSTAFRRFCNEAVEWEIEQHWTGTMPERWVRLMRGSEL